MNVRRDAVVMIAAALMLSGCGGSDVPSKSEFVSKLSTTLDAQIDAMEKAGLDRDAAEKLVTDFIGCTYDKIKTDEELVSKVYEEGDSADSDAELEKQAKECSTGLQEAVSAAMQDGTTSG